MASAALRPKPMRIQICGLGRALLLRGKNAAKTVAIATFLVAAAAAAASAAL